MNRKGFTLIELLVGIAIIITTTTVVLSIIVSSFRISSKNTANDRVRQSGNSVISQLSRMIQFSDSFLGVSTTDSNYLPICDAGTPYNYLKINYRGIDKTIRCSTNDLSVRDNDTGTFTSMLDNNIKVVSSTCNIKCSIDGATPVIGISFQLQYGDPSLASEKTSKIDFSTSIKMRNN